MNPNDFQFKDWDQYNFFLYVICEDSEAAEKISKLDVPEDRYERVFGKTRPKTKQAEEAEKDPLEGDGPILVSNSVMGKKDISEEEEKQSFLKNQHNSVQGEHASINSTKKAKTNKSSSKKGKDITFKGGEVDHNDNENDYDKVYDMYKKPQTQMDVGDSQNFEKLNNHIVVCGIHSSIMHFILPLRAKYLESK